MTYLVLAVVLVGLLGLANLLLVVGVVRRLREHSALLAELQAEPVVGLPDGAQAGPFEARTVDGEPVSNEDIADVVAVGFFSTDCPACRDLLPGFVERARALGREKVLVVVTGDPEDASDMVPKLSDVARVVIEEHGGPLAAAFAVRAWPLLYRLDDTTVAATGHTADVLPAPVHV